jgi:hypothetical protein
LKKRGMRTLDPRLGVDPKLAGPACWRGTEMCGFIFFCGVFLFAARDLNWSDWSGIGDHGARRFGVRSHSSTCRSVMSSLGSRGGSVEWETPEAERGSIRHSWRERLIDENRRTTRDYVACCTRVSM